MLLELTLIGGGVLATRCYDWFAKPVIMRNFSSLSALRRHQESLFKQIGFTTDCFDDRFQVVSRKSATGSSRAKKELEAYGKLIAETDRKALSELTALKDRASRGDLTAKREIRVQELMGQLHEEEAIRAELAKQETAKDTPVDVSHMVEAAVQQPTPSKPKGRPPKAQAMLAPSPA